MVKWLIIRKSIPQDLEQNGDFEEITKLEETF